MGEKFPKREIYIILCEVTRRMSVEWGKAAVQPYTVPRVKSCCMRFRGLCRRQNAALADRMAAKRIDAHFGNRYNGFRSMP